MRPLHGLRPPSSTTIIRSPHLHLRHLHSSTPPPAPKWRPPPTFPEPIPTSFYKAAVTPTQTTPHQFPANHFTPLIPAIQNWFRLSPQNPTTSTLNYAHLDPHASTTYLPMEMTTTTNNPNHPTKTATKTFTRSTSPLSSFLAYTRLPPSPHTRITIAQAPLSALPPLLQQDFSPTLSLLTDPHKRDIYASNLWLGLAPTSTPLHRDPNPNLFVQLAGRKRIRLLSPEVGERVFQEVCPRQRGGMRGEEMMVDEEGLEGVVWGEQGRGLGLEREGWEVEIQAGGGLFIPKGWWHAVRGVGDGVVGSVNWWFR